MGHDEMFEDRLVWAFQMFLEDMIENGSASSVFITFIARRRRPVWWNDKRTRDKRRKKYERVCFGFDDLIGCSPLLFSLSVSCSHQFRWSEQSKTTGSEPRQRKLHTNIQRGKRRDSSLEGGLVYQCPSESEFWRKKKKEKERAASVCTKCLCNGWRTVLRMMSFSFSDRVQVTDHDKALFFSSYFSGDRRKCSSNNGLMSQTNFHSCWLIRCVAPSW